MQPGTPFCYKDIIFLSSLYGSRQSYKSQNWHPALTDRENSAGAQWKIAVFEFVVLPGKFYQLSIRVKYVKWFRGYHTIWA